MFRPDEFEHAAVNVVYMCHPCGWVEPGHTLEFDDYTLVLQGAHTVERGDDG